MSGSTFLILTLIVLFLAVFIRIFWVYLLIIWVLLRILFGILIISIVSAIAWMLFVEDYKSGPIDGFWLTCTFFFILYSAIVVVSAFIVSDIYGYFKELIRDILGK